MFLMGFSMFIWAIILLIFIFLLSGVGPETSGDDNFFYLGVAANDEKSSNNLELSPYRSVSTDCSLINKPSLSFFTFLTAPSSFI